MDNTPSGSKPETKRSKRGNKFKIYINKGELKQIHEWVKAKPDIETGGDLFGLWMDASTAVVQFVLGPGRGCRRTTTSFHQDISYLENAGNCFTQQHGLCNIGQWHSHHKIQLFEPSAGDHITVWSNMPKLDLERFIVFIANIKDSGVTVNCFLFEIKNGQQLPVKKGKMVELPEESPLRSNNAVMEIVRIGAESLIKKHLVPLQHTEKNSSRNETKGTTIAKSNNETPAKNGMSDSPSIHDKNTTVFATTRTSQSKDVASNIGKKNDNISDQNDNEKNIDNNKRKKQESDNTVMKIVRTGAESLKKKVPLPPPIKGNSNQKKTEKTAMVESYEKISAENGMGSSAGVHSKDTTVSTTTSISMQNMKIASNSRKEKLDNIGHQNINNNKEKKQEKTGATPETGGSAILLHRKSKSSKTKVPAPSNKEHPNNPQQHNTVEQQPNKPSAPIASNSRKERLDNIGPQNINKNKEKKQEKTGATRETDGSAMLLHYKSKLSKTKVPAPSNNKHPNNPQQPNTVKQQPNKPSKPIYKVSVPVEPEYDKTVLHRSNDSGNNASPKNDTTTTAKDKKENLVNKNKNGSNAKRYTKQTQFFQPWMNF